MGCHSLLWNCSNLWDIQQEFRCIEWPLKVARNYFKIATITRMHFSRMRTGRSLTVCCSLLLGGCLVRGWVCSQGVSAPRGVCSRGVCFWGVYPSMHWGRHPPPLWTDTRLWKYYLDPTSLRPVIIANFRRLCAPVSSKIFDLSREYSSLWQCHCELKNWLKNQDGSINMTAVLRHFLEVHSQTCWM